MIILINYLQNYVFMVYNICCLFICKLTFNADLLYMNYFVAKAVLECTFPVKELSIFRDFFIQPE